MNSIENLISMIFTDAIENNGKPTTHYFDETRNPNYNPLETYEPKKEDSTLPPLQYNLDLIENPDGSLEWVD
jgi:hypothetical protein